MNYAVMRLKYVSMGYVFWTFSFLVLCDLAPIGEQD
jgi:hypothetical protein